MVEEKIIEKIQKLLALATSSNEHEAAAAASKAQELLLKYNLDMSQVEKKEEEEIELFNFDDYSKMSSWRSRLLNGIARALTCQIVMETGRMSDKGKHTRFYMFGKPESIQVSIYLYEYLCRELLKISKRPVSSPESHAFRVGAVETINVRLMDTYKEFREATPDTKALILATEALVEAKKNKTFPTLSESRRGKISDYQGYSAGREAGKHIPLSKGVTSNRNSAGQFLLK